MVYMVYGELKVIVTITWNIWGARNKLLFRRQFSSPQAIYARAQRILESFGSCGVAILDSNLSSVVCGDDSVVR